VKNHNDLELDFLTKPQKILDLKKYISDDINKTGGLPAELEIFVGAKVMIRANIDVKKGLVNGTIGVIKKINWNHFRMAQVYSQDDPSVVVEISENCEYEINLYTVQFPAKFNFGTIERRMLPMVLSWASTVHKMQGSTVDNAVVYLGSHLFKEGQAYVALSRVRSLEGLAIEELDCRKLTGKVPCNKQALEEMKRMRQ